MATPTRVINYPSQLCPSPDALTLLDAIMIAGGEVGPKTHQPPQPRWPVVALIPSGVNASPSSQERGFWAGDRDRSIFII